MIRRAWRSVIRGVRAEAHGWHTGAAIIAEEQAQTPAPPPVTFLSGGGAGPHPVPGQQPSPAPAQGRGVSPPRPAPAPAPPPRLLMSSRFYSDGVVYVDNHITRKTTRFDPPPDEDDWDAAFERMQAGDHPDGF